MKAKNRFGLGLLMFIIIVLQMLQTKVMEDAIGFAIITVIAFIGFCALVWE